LNDYSTNDQASESLVRMLRDYRERQQEFHIFDSYDEALSRTRERLAEKRSKIVEPLNTIATRLFSIVDRSFFLLHVCQWKMDFVAEALIHSIEARNPVAMANDTRALVEHFAALTAILLELERLEEHLRGQSREPLIRQALERTEIFVHRAYYGKSPKLAKSKTEQAHHVNDLLEALRTEWGDVENCYDFLCEYVHPNYGSNTLVSTGEIAGGRLNPPEDFHEQVIAHLYYFVGRCMIQVRSLGLRYGGVLVRLQNLVDLCFVPRARISNVFSLRASSPHGDGKSLETAYSFPKARTPLEAMELCYTFLQREGYIVQGRQQGGSIGGSVYDVYATDRGPVWFRMPSMTLPYPPDSQEQKDDESSTH
jgi:hypothetical protein